MRKSRRQGPEVTQTSAIPEKQKAGKHLIETSLLRPLITGSQPFKERVTAELGDGRRYTSSFVRMEFRRSLLLPIAQFCIQLRLPQVRSADDLLAQWSNEFGERRTKVVLHMCRHLAPLGIDTHSPVEKEAVFQCLARLVLELEAKLSLGMERLGDSGHRCERAKPNLLIKATHPDEILEALVSFVEAIQDEAHCRARCTIDRFLGRERAVFERWAAEADLIRGDARKGMRDSAPHAQKALASGLPQWTCKECNKLGDWIITLDCPTYLQVEHLDRIYDHLCPSRGLAHRKHAPDRPDTSAP
jgi:hypothetical protein